MRPQKTPLLPSSAALPWYGISNNGFLPAEAPLKRLSNDYYYPWESMVAELPSLIDKQLIRQRVHTLPVLETSYLETEAEWRRAYSILALVAQGFIWTGPEPSERLPPAITVPLLKASARLEVYPIATYASLNLWNWAPRTAESNLEVPENLVSLHTASGTDDESWFFNISNSIEAGAGTLIHNMLAAIEAADVQDRSTVIDSLHFFKSRMQTFGLLLERMDERCDPQIFYHSVRPMLAGSMNMEAAGLPRGVFYDEGNGQGTWKAYRGGSNGQSSLLQFCDVVLSVHHTRSDGFHAEMRQYMPGPHARFLRDLENVANIRDYVYNRMDDASLVAAFNGAVRSLVAFRAKHIALVTRYIIIPSRAVLPKTTITRTDIASTTSKLVQADKETQELIGTGGTKLIPFLRTSKDETAGAEIR